LHDAFVGFWKYDMIVPGVQVQCRVPGFEEKSLVVISFETNDLDNFKVYVLVEMVDMACNFGVLVKTCHCLFALSNSVLKWFFCLAIVHKITLCAIDFEHYA